MNVLITGGAGFIGSYLAEKFDENGFNVHIIDNLFRGRMENIEHLLMNGSGHTYHEIDIANKENTGSIRDILVKYKPDYILHYAAINGTQYFYDMSSKVLNNNIAMTQNIIEAIRLAKEKADFETKVIYASSSEVYGEPFTIPTPETDITYFRVEEDRDSYSASKLISESLIRLNCNDLNIPWMNLRLFNVYGNRMVGTKYGQVIPEFISRMLDGEYPLTILGDGEHRRSFCEVNDNVEITYQLVINGDYLETYNVGNDVEVSILDIAKEVFNALDLEFAIKKSPARKGDHLRRKPDISKLRKVIKEYEFMQVEEGIKHMVDGIISERTKEK